MQNNKKRIITGLILAAIVICGLVFFEGKLFALGYTLAAMMVILELATAMVFTDRVTDPYDGIRTLLLGIVIQLIVFFSMVEVWQLSAKVIALAIVTACVNDTSAYFVGRGLGHKFFPGSPFPKVSPKKTWEGIIGGWVITACVLALVGMLPIYADLSRRVLNSLIWFGAFFGILGDFLASFYKRRTHLKDSGEVLLRSKTVLSQVEKPLASHGGYLDRLDSISSLIIFIAFLIHITS